MVQGLGMSWGHEYYGLWGYGLWTYKNSICAVSQFLSQTHVQVLANPFWENSISQISNPLKLKQIVKLPYFRFTTIADQTLTQPHHPNAVQLHSTILVSIFKSTVNYKFAKQLHHQT